ncbi:MAG TPA: DNA-processing protein DprA [Gammaproteobacteria bacterium]|nr:DNA-processing protein DprA [Gammaproteobacteria bacterium]
MSARLTAWLDVLQAGQPGAAGWAAALAHYGDIEALRAAPRAGLREFGLNDATVQRLRSPDAQLLSSWRHWLEAPQHHLATIDQPEFPPRLAQCPGAPLALWLRGEQRDLLAAPALAIVGSRNASAGGRDNAQAFAQALGASGLAIVSGLALGIDAAAHVGALNSAGGTVAVLGNGIDEIYPPENAALAQRIEASGLIVSEYGPGTPPRRHRFPARNRIIAALSYGVLVVEAGSRSGSLITARLAGEFGREVFAIPGSIHNPLSRGCHQLIRQGARLVETADDVLQELAPALRAALAAPAEYGVEPIRDAREAGCGAPQPAPTLAPEYQRLLDSIGFDPSDITTIVRRSTLTTAEVSSMLLLLELEGHVEALPGGRYARTP